MTNPAWFWVVFPLFFAALWLLTTTLIASIAGVPTLAARFPDQDEAPLATYRPYQVVMGGGARLRGRLLQLAACPGGVRLSIPRLFAPFTRPALVPWDQVRVLASRTARETARLTLGGVEIEMPAGTAERLMAHAPVSRG